MLKLTAPKLQQIALSTKVISEQIAQGCSGKIIFMVKSGNIFGSRRVSTTPLIKDGIVRSPFADISIPEDNLAYHVMKEFPKYPQKVALVNGLTGQQWTYPQLTDAIARVGSALVKMGLRKGDVLTVFSPNCPEFAIVYLATQAIGGVVSPLNPMYTSYELKHALVHNESKFLVVANPLMAVASSVIKECPELKYVISIGESDGTRPFESLLSHEMDWFPTSMDVNAKEDLCALPYSSGTTGLPKGVMLTHYNVVANLRQLGNKNGLNYTEGEERFIAVLPFFHIYGQVVIFLVGLLQGATITTVPKFDPEVYLRLCQDTKATFLQIVPPLVIFLAKHPLVDKFNLSSVRDVFTGAAPIGKEVLLAAKQRLRLESFRSGYGMTEASPVTHLENQDTDLGVGSVGQNVSNLLCKVVDIETSRALGPHQEGEVIVKGPNVMKGYFKNTEATNSTIQDGWLCTGDIGFYDANGYVTISDRLKELIKVKGFQVAPAELEALLLTHPKIQDAAVIGMPDERSGELPRAYVVLKPNTQMVEEEVKAYIKDKLAPHKWLDGGVEFRSEIPKAASGKILRRVLKDELKSKTY